MTPGSSVVLYTDGVIEARAGEELFGEERLDLYLSEHAELSAQALADGVLAACRAFAGEVSDDVAVVVARKL